MEPNAPQDSKRRFVVLSALAALAAAPSLANAQKYPERPVKLIAPFAAGGVLDMIARLLGDKLGAMWGQAVVVENRTGAAGMIGAELVVKSAPDGHTLLVASTAETAINQSLFKKMSYSPEKDLAPVTLVATSPLVFVAPPALKVNTFAEFVELAKARARPVAYASAGTGGVQHMAAALLAHELKVKMTHVPYRGAAPAMTDLLSGEVDIMIQSAPLVMPYIKSGKLVALAVTSAEPIPLLPGVPTFNAELRMADFLILNWYAIFAPAKTPDSLLARLNSDVASVMRQPDVREKLLAAGATPVGNSRDDFQKFWRSEVAKYKRLIEISGATAD